ncbi:hypothetical protein FRUB_07610 [Fimbriiglobus ruber]|uniref:Uncharacterized protein n=1 Tax=Fimbriiglobus ruber TaxID=1908690 RepID=A0A225DA71_9BACT|nr:hypothetical protein FRUB_07610 [Fimbriiglobus ruber]
MWRQVVARFAANHFRDILRPTALLQSVEKLLHRTSNT